MTRTPSDALATVRQAYRYLEQYQRRVLDAFTMIEGGLSGFVPVCWRSGTSWNRGRLPMQVADRLLVDLEVSWACGAGHEDGEGTYVIVRHVADTLAVSGGQSRPDPRESDSILHGLVVRPHPRFEERAFSRTNWSCVAEHFPADADTFKTLKAGDPVEGGSDERGWWYLHVFSLASVVEPGDFATKFVNPLAKKAVALSPP